MSDHPHDPDQPDAAQGLPQEACRGTSAADTTSPPTGDPASTLPSTDIPATSDAARATPSGSGAAGPAVADGQPAAAESSIGVQPGSADATSGTETPEDVSAADAPSVDPTAPDAAANEQPPAATHPAPIREPGEAELRLAEAMVFSSTDPVPARALAQVMPDDVDPAAVVEALRARYAGRGVELVDVAGGVQFRTAADLAPALRKVISVPRRLTRVAMETLAIIAYHQPVTRPEIEQLRGTSLSQQTLDALLEAKLVAPAGRLEGPGRPTLWATTPEFLTAFGLQDLRALPRREDLFVEPPRPTAAPPAPDPAANDAEEAVGGTMQKNDDRDPVSPAPASC